MIDKKSRTGIEISPKYLFTFKVNATLKTVAFTIFIKWYTYFENLSLYPKQIRMRSSTNKIQLIIINTIY